MASIGRSSRSQNNAAKVYARMNNSANKSKAHKSHRLSMKIAENSMAGAPSKYAFRDTRAATSYSTLPDDFWNSSLLDIVSGTSEVSEVSSDTQKVITEHDKELANLASRVYPGYFDALSNIATPFSVPTIDFDNNTSEYKALAQWGGNADEFVGEVPFSKSGCDAVLYQNQDTGKYVLSFRGTTAQIQDLIEDFTLLAQPDPDVFGGYFQFEEADKIVKEIIDTYGEEILNNIEFTGHSLGGALAQGMALKYGAPATGFNSVGVPDAALKKIHVEKDEQFWENAKNITHLNVSGDPMTDWNWEQSADSFFDTMPRYGENYWLPSKFNLPGSRIRNHFYNVVVHQMDQNSTAQKGESILSADDL